MKNDIKFKSPLLAANGWDSEEEQLSVINYPIYASPKIDGVRGICYKEKFTGRSGKRFKNEFITKRLSSPFLEGFDGELTVGNPKSDKVFNITSGEFRKIKGEPNFTWWIFDDYSCQTEPFCVRYAGLREKVRIANEKYNAAFSKDGIFEEKFVLLNQVIINNDAELLEFEKKCIEEGYEGVMVRSIDGKYKYGRSTLKEGILLKIKRFSFDEAEIVGYEQEYKNNNENFINELGRKTRSGHKENLTPVDRLAKFICKSKDWQETFQVSCTSMNHSERATAWKEKDSYIGKIVRYKHFKYGAKDRPRMPIFSGFRDEVDM